MSDEVIHPLNIGSVHLRNNLILAPMAGVSDLPFRLICHEMGAGLVCMEMISAKALQFKNKKTFDLMKTSEAERPVSLQLFGSDSDCISKSAGEIEGNPFDILDINMGCPVPKVVKNGDGSALMRKPKKAGQIIEKCVKATSKPVTIKIRKGFDDESVNAVEIARIAEAKGAAAIAVHGRTSKQYYSGCADWDIIRQVKEAVSIPVIGNGDLKCASDVKRMYETTGCDGFMIARAAQGNPWVFSEILNEIKNGDCTMRPDIDEVKRMILRHADMQIKLHGEYVGIRQMRKHAAWYVGGYSGASAWRRKINEAETIEEFRTLFS